MGERRRAAHHVDDEGRGDDVAEAEQAVGDGAGPRSPPEQVPCRAGVRAAGADASSGGTSQATARLATQGERARWRTTACVQVAPASAAPPPARRRRRCRRRPRRNGRPRARRGRRCGQPVEHQGRAEDQREGAGHARDEPQQQEDRHGGREAHRRQANRSRPRAKPAARTGACPAGAPPPARRRRNSRRNSPRRSGRPATW